MNFFEYLKRKALGGEKDPPAPVSYIWVRDSTGRYLYDANGIKIVVEVY